MSRFAKKLYGGGDLSTSSGVAVRLFSHRVTWSADAATDTLSGLIRQPFVCGSIFLSAIDVVNAYFDNAITPALLCSAAQH